LFYVAYNFFFKGKGDPAVPAVPTTDATGKPLPPHRPLYKGNEVLDLKMYVSTEEFFDQFKDERLLIWTEKNLRLDNKDDERGPVEVLLYTSENSPFYHNITQNPNSTIYIHVYFVKQGFSPDPTDSNYRKNNFFYSRKIQNRFFKPRPVNTKKNLLSDDNNQKDIQQDIHHSKQTEIDPLINSNSSEPISHWCTNFTINIVDDTTVYPRNQILPHIAHLVQPNDQGSFPPLIFFNDFWTLSSSFHPLAANYSSKSPSLLFSFSHLPPWKLHLLLQMQQSLDMQLTLGASSKDTDDIKEMLLDTNPYFLALTMSVSLLHSVFDFLAFKNDISFWKQRKSMRGLSIKTIFFNTATQIIIFLYLLDNDTSFLILMSTGIGILIEAWKISKAVKVTVQQCKWNGKRD